MIKQKKLTVLFNQQWNEQWYNEKRRHMTCERDVMWHVRKMSCDMWERCHVTNEKDVMWHVRKMSCDKWERCHVTSENGIIWQWERCQVTSDICRVTSEKYVLWYRKWERRHVTKVWDWLSLMSFLLTSCV